MVLDECIAAPASEVDARDADGTVGTMGPARPDPAAALRGDAASAPEVLVSNPGQAQFGIIQGVTYPALRTASVEATSGSVSRATPSAA